MLGTIHTVHNGLPSLRRASSVTDANALLVVALASASVVLVVADALVVALTVAALAAVALAAVALAALPTCMISLSVMRLNEVTKTAMASVSWRNSRVGRRCEKA